MAGLDVGLTGTATATIMIDDKNDHSPKFTKKEVKTHCPPPTTPAARGHGRRARSIPRATAPAGGRFANRNPPGGRGGVVLLFGTFSRRCLLCVHKAGKSVVRTKALNLVKVHKKITFNAKVPFS